MAYAFNALDNYFKRDRKTQTAGGGDLQKGAGTGAPPPTAAAEGLARKAETSAEQGNAAGRFQAMQNAPTGAIAGRLAATGQQKAANWNEQSKKQEGEYRAGAEQQGQQTFKEFKPESVGQVEAGDQGATQLMGQQLNYGTENAPGFDIAPMQVTAPTLDTTSMLRGGVGGIQAALQKRGGRYTPGMAAMDASALAANRGAIGQLQSQFGGIQEGMRLRGEQMKGLEGTLETEQTERGKKIASDVKAALGTRSGELEKISKDAAEKERLRRGGEGKEKAKGLAKGYWEAGGYGPTDVMPLVAGQGSFVENVDPGYANVFRMLYGRNPTPQEISFQTFSPDYALIDTEIKRKKDEADRLYKANNGNGINITPSGDGKIQIPISESPVGPTTTETYEDPRRTAKEETKKVTAPMAGITGALEDVADPGGMIRSVLSGSTSDNRTQQEVAATQARDTARSAADQMNKQSNSDYDIKETDLMSFYNTNGRYPTQQEMGNFQKTGRFTAPQAPKAPTATSIRKRFF